MAFQDITSTDLNGKGVVGLPDVPGLTTTAMQQKLDEIALDVIVPAFNALVAILNSSTVTENFSITDPVDSAVKTLQLAVDNLKAYVDTQDATKADIASTLAGYGIADAYTQTVIDNYLAAKADLAVTLAGYGITDAYTQTEVDNLLAGKVDTVTGKGLSTNDYDNTEKGAVASNTAARHTHSNQTTLDAITAAVKTTYDALVTLLNGITSVDTTVTNDDTAIPTCGAIVDYVTMLGGGDMAKAVYDTDNDGIVDNSETLEGHAASYFATDSDMTAVENRATALEGTTATLTTNVASLLAGQTPGGSKTTVFNADGSITETWTADGNYKTTVFNADGSITETMYDANANVLWTKATVFNADGSITETVS